MAGVWNRRFAAPARNQRRSHVDVAASKLGDSDDYLQLAYEILASTSTPSTVASPTFHCTVHEEPLCMRICIVSVVVACFFTALAFSQTADELVNKNIQAKGGIDKIKAI